MEGSPGASRLWVVSVFAVAALVAVIAHAHFATDLRAATSRISLGSHVVRTPCGPIEYALAGTGPPLLLIHGAGGGFDQGLAFGAPLVRAGFTVIAPSRFGYLRTPLPKDASPSIQANAHVCLLDALGFARAAVLGGSAGAPSAFQLCLHHRERCSALILLVPAIFLANDTRPAPKPSAFAQRVIRTTLSSDFVFWLAAHLAPDIMIESILATPREDVANANPQEQRRVRAILRDILPIRRRAAGLWADATITTVPAQFEFEQLRIPTLIITTANDLFGTAIGSRAAARRIPRARLIEYPNGGHVWVGHQGEIWTEIVRFLNSRANSLPQG